MEDGWENEKVFEKEQFSILSSQLESILNQNNWNNSSKEEIVKTATKIKCLIGTENRNSEYVEKTVNMLTKAKVKAVMSNDERYYDICSRLDSIISSLTDKG